MDRKSCDVVVIGSGIGGMCTAARLSHAGYKTIMLERGPILGGRYNWVEYKGYRVNIAALTVYYGKKDPVFRTLHDVGANADFETRALSLPKWRWGGKDHETPARGGFWLLLSMASRNKEEEARVTNAFRRALRWREPSDSITASEWVLSLTDNKTIWSIFQAWCIQIVGPNLYEVGAGEMCRCFRNFAGTDQIIPEKGLTSVVDSLAKAIADNKGEILSLTEAQRIIVNDGVAQGVVARGPDFELNIEAKVVVSNVGPRMTVQLAGEDNFDRGYLNDIRELRPVGGLWVFITSDGPLYDWKGGLYTLETRRADLWEDYTLTWPEFAPPGKNIMFVYQEPPNGVYYDPGKEYQAFLADFAETFPNAHKQNAEILLARRHHTHWPVYRAFPASESYLKTPVQNLYNVGDALNPTGWLAGSGAAESARLAAEDIKTKIKPGA